MARVGVAAMVTAASLLAGSGPAPAWSQDARPQTAQAWREAALSDVNAAYDTLAANHPGMVDRANPGFAQSLAAARDAGLDIAQRVETAEGYRAALARFNTSLGDGHAGATATLPAEETRPREYPGFVPVWRGGRFLVHTSWVDAIPRGAEILECDGDDAETLALRTAFAFEGRPEEAGQWWVLARNAFVDTHNPFVQRPRQCTFGHGETRWSQTLEWREETETFRRVRVASYNGEVLPIGMTEPSPGVFWVALPSFDPDEAGVAAYATLNEALRSRRRDIAAARAVVLDLRGNQGGSSVWSQDVAKALWGARPVETAIEADFGRVRIEWRPTVDNEAALRAYVPELEAQGQADVARLIRTLAGDMAAARAAGEPLMVEEGSRKTPPRVVESDFDRPVYVITPGQCASACLDAVDVFSLFPNTKRIGAPTSADSTYLEVRSETLPSGLATVRIPMKTYVGRPRAGGEIIEPDIIVRALDWSTQDFLAEIQADLDESQ